MEKGSLIKVIVAVVILLVAVVLIANSLGLFGPGTPEQTVPTEGNVENMPDPGFGN